MYTDRKVYRPLADKLPVAAPATADVIRWSVVGGSETGIAGQRTTHFSIYGSDPDIAAISTLPEAAWDPGQPEVGARHGVTWIRMKDLHHNAVGNEPICGVMQVGDTVLLHITLSTTIKHIVREDGEDENGVTKLVMALINHYPTLRRIRWADDVTRAGRDRADWSQITTKCKHRDIVMVFGGQSYDQSKPGDELALAALGMVGGSDDPARRRKLTGKRLMKYKLGGAAIAEKQMPHGWHHKKDKHGRPVNEGERGLVPEANPTMIQVIPGLYEPHAKGETYQAIAGRMVAFESEGVLHRRDHTDLDNTYARTLDDPLASYDAAKSFFVRSSFRPRKPPSELAIARYLEGEDPADVFDADVRLYLAKVELVRTGRYFRRLRNDIRGRNIVLDGIPATYQDDRDEYGWFDVLSAPWAWPVDPSGREVPRFGLSDETCRRVAARLLRELRAPKAATGGQAHRTATRRVLQAFTNWTTQPGEPASKYDDEATQWGVEARSNNSGRANFVVLFRRQSAGEGPRTGRGWSYFGPGERKPDHIAATGSLTELAASAAFHLDAAVRNLADPTSIATLTEIPPDPQPHDQTATWRHQIDLKRAEIEPLTAEAKGHRTMAALAAGAGDEGEARAYATQASEAQAKVRALETQIKRLEAKIHEGGHGSTASREDRADVSVAAYLVAGLEDAARHNGEGPTRLAKLCDQSLTDWHFSPRDEDLAWSCNALLPLSTGGHALLPLTGTIRNVRSHTGKNLATTETVMRYVFEEGRDLTSVAHLLQVSRKTLLVKRIMPSLVAVGVTARGAKCALVDHPLPEVRRDVYAWVTRGLDTPTAPVTSPYTQRVRATYLDPDLAWGDAAVPDDTTWIAAALRLLTPDTETRRHGLPVLDVAIAVGRSEPEVRELVKPQKRAGGFTRPRYLAYSNKAKTHVKAIGCPHDRCKGRRYADHAVLLPEVAASGYGVICTHCRRTPATHGAWPRTQFPTKYLGSWTTHAVGGSLRHEAQTVSTPGLG